MRGKLVMVSAVMFLGLSFGLMVADVKAFCVYNKTDKTIEAVQQSGGVRYKMFSQTIPRNESRCCNWKENDCNTSGKQDGIVTFEVSYNTPIPHTIGNFASTIICSDFQIQAGGALVVEKSNGSYRCVRYDPN